MELTVDSDKFNKLLKETVQQRHAIQRVRDLHTKENWDVCPVCCTWSEEEQDYVGYTNPCPTIKALDGVE